MSEQTRQFYAYKDIADRWIPHVVGAFRAATEEHLPLTLLNDWDLNADALARYAVLVLPNAAAMSDAQAEAVRGSCARAAASWRRAKRRSCDELGRPHGDFALADLFGVSFQGRPKAPLQRPDARRELRRGPRRILLEAANRRGDADLGRPSRWCTTTGWNGSSHDSRSTSAARWSR